VTGNKRYTKNEETETKTNNASAPLIQYRFKIRGGSPEGFRQKTMTERVSDRNEF